MGYQKGDKIVLRDDLVVGGSYSSCKWTEAMQELLDLPYLTIKYANKYNFYMLEETGCTVSKEMISHKYEEEHKYIWYIEDSNVTYYLAKGHNHKISPDFHLDSVKKHTPSAFYLEKVFKGEVEQALLTEEEARQSVFFHTLKKHTPPAKKQLYYVCTVGDTEICVNYDIKWNNYYIGSMNEHDNNRTKFTEEEADKIIGASIVLYKKEAE